MAGPTDFLLNRGTGPDLEIDALSGDVVIDVATSYYPPHTDVYSAAAIMVDNPNRGGGGNGPLITSLVVPTFNSFVLSMWTRNTIDNSPFYFFGTRTFEISLGNLRTNWIFENSDFDVVTFGGAVSPTDRQNIDGWLNFIVSSDATNQQLQIYLNDESVTFGDEPLWLNPGPFFIDPDSTFYWTGNDFGDPSVNSIADFFFTPTTEFVDLSIEANRRKFITSDYKPVDLGDDGKVPFGTAPFMWYSYRQPALVVSDITFSAELSSEILISLPELVTEIVLASDTVSKSQIILDLDTSIALQFGLGSSSVITANKISNYPPWPLDPRFIAKLPSEICAIKLLDEKWIV